MTDETRAPLPESGTNNAAGAALDGPVIAGGLSSGLLRESLRPGDVAPAAPTGETPRTDCFAEVTDLMRRGLHKAADDVRRSNWPLLEREVYGLRAALSQAHTRLALAPQSAIQPPLGWWSFLRSVLSQGASIQQDYMAGNHKDYEEYSARLDAAARERADQISAVLAAVPSTTQPRAPVAWMDHKRGKFISAADKDYLLKEWPVHAQSYDVALFAIALSASGRSE